MVINKPKALYTQQERLPETYMTIHEVPMLSNFWSAGTLCAVICCLHEGLHSLLDKEEILDPKGAIILGSYIVDKIAIDNKKLR